MSALIVEWPWLVGAGFNRPNVQPPTFAKFNRAHHLLNGSVNWLFNSDDNSSLGGYAGSGGTRYNDTVGFRGRLCTSASETNYPWWPIDGTPVPPSVPAKMTVFAIFVGAGGEELAHLIGRDESVSTDRCYQFRYSTDAYLSFIFFISNNAYTVTSTVPIGTYFPRNYYRAVCATYDGVTAKLFSEGQEIGSLSQSGTIDADAAGISIGARNTQNATKVVVSTENGKSVIHLAGELNRAWSPDEARAWTMDPYQMMTVGR